MQTHSYPPVNRTALLTVLCSAALYLIFSAVMANHYYIHSDEVQSVDRGLNLYYHGRYVTNAHRYFYDFDFAVSSSILNDAVVYTWAKLFGGSLAAIRFLSYLLAAATAILFWRFAARTRVAENSAIAALLAPIALFSGPMYMSWRYHRYDLSGMVVVALLYYVLSLAPGRRKFALLLFSAMLLPFAGLQHIAYAGLIGIFALVFRLFKFKDVLPAVFGGAIGVAAYAFLLASLGQLNNFVENVIFPKQISSLEQGYWDSLVHSVFNNWMNNLLMAGCGIGLLWGVVKRNGELVRTGAAGLAIAMIIPLFFAGLLGHFTRWYAWMPFFPLSYLYIRLLDKARPQRPLFYALCGFLLCSLLLPLPLMLAKTLLEYKETHYGSVERFVAERLPPDKRVFSDVYAYYPAMELSEAVYLRDDVLDVMSESDRNAIDCAILTKMNEDQTAVDMTLQKLGGTWKPAGELKVRRSALRQKIPIDSKEKYVYHLVIYERDKP